MISNLLTTADFIGFVQLSDNLNNGQVIENYISRAQNDERKYWTNDALFIQLLANPTDQRFINLLSGVNSYTDAAGNLRIFQGLKPQIAFWTAAKLTKSGYVRHTDLGYAISNSENTRHLTPEETKAYYFEMKNKALQYEAETIEYLDSNKTVYPEWANEYILRSGVLGLYR